MSSFNKIKFKLKNYFPVIKIRSVKIEGVVLRLLDLPVVVVVLNIKNIRNFIAISARIPLFILLPIYQRKVW